MGLVKQVVLAIQEISPSETTLQEVTEAMRVGERWCPQLESLKHIQPQCQLLRYCLA